MTLIWVQNQTTCLAHVVPQVVFYTKVNIKTNQITNNTDVSSTSLVHLYPRSPLYSRNTEQNINSVQIKRGSRHCSYSIAMESKALLKCLIKRIISRRNSVRCYV